MYWVTRVLGILFATAPFLLNYTNNSGALWTSLILGAITILLSFLQARSKKFLSWEYWTAGAAGIAAIIAPFLLGYTHISQAVVISIVLGLLLSFSAITELFIDQSN